MTRAIRSNDPADEAIRLGHEVEESIQQLCGITGTQPRMTPADVSALLADLAAATAALPQLARQLGDILNRSQRDYLLTMDPMAHHDDPTRAVETARLRLGAIRAPALDLYQLLDAAHNETAHIATTDRPVLLCADPPGVRRPADRPPTVTDKPGRSVPR
ncbi:MAG: hypothetical protein LH477_07505 [Nocardioides sp.]|nr:hypothetical protein [Nocardioides sp.]